MTIEKTVIHYLPCILRFVNFEAVVKIRVQSTQSDSRIFFNGGGGGLQREARVLHFKWPEIPFYAPGLKCPPGASSNRIVCPSVVCLSVRNSVPRPYKVQYIKFGWSYRNQSWPVSSSKGFSHFTDITCPWGWGGVKIWDFEILPDFNFVAARRHPSYGPQPCTRPVFYRSFSVSWKFLLCTFVHNKL